MTNMPGRLNASCLTNTGLRASSGNSFLPALARHVLPAALLPAHPDLAGQNRARQSDFNALIGRSVDYQRAGVRG